MNTEYEVRILEIKKDEIIKELEKRGAKKIGEWIQRRYVYDTKPKEKARWYRLRTNGEITTLTYKSIDKNTIDGTKELEIEVSDFEKTNELLEIMGYNYKAYQENKRLKYFIDDVEVDIDTWPLIPTYMEIEGKTEKSIKNILKELNIDEKMVTTLNCEDIYLKRYGIDINSYRELKF